MLIRKYRAKNLKEVLSQIKEDLGEGATILSTRTVRAGFLRTQLEVTAALTPHETAAKPMAKSETAPRRSGGAGNLTTDVQQIARFLSPIREEIRALHAEMKALNNEPTQTERVENALHEFRDLLKALHHNPSANEESLTEAILPALREKLIGSGMRISLVEKILEKLAAQLPPHPDEALACAEGLTARIMATDLKCVPALELPGPPRVAALIGPAGVGKTTTLAKIATRAALIHDRSVAVIGWDHERIGAVRSLQETAQIIGIPFQAAYSTADLCQSVEKLQKNSLVLVDTSGHSARDPGAMAVLQRTLAEAKIDPYLLLNADMRILEIDANVNGFAAVQPQALVFTKIDQAIGLGGLYDAATESGLPVMYLTNGRRIPDDIEEATPERIASLIMGFQYN